MATLIVAIPVYTDIKLYSRVYLSCNLHLLLFYPLLFPSANIKALNVIYLFLTGAKILSFALNYLEVTDANGLLINLKKAKDPIP
jgi:hypothetical protein